MVKLDELAFLDATAQAELVRCQEVRAIELDPANKEFYLNQLEMIKKGQWGHDRS